MSYLQTLSSTLPILFLVTTGILIRKMRLLKEGTIQDLKKFVISISLPLLLFKAFATLAFEPQYLIVIAAVFFACTLIMFLASRLNFLPGLSSKYSSYLMAGFEAGMLGYAVFGAIYGIENISHFAVIDLGQVIFVFFILITRLEFQQSHRLSLSQTFLKFFKTPVILGILIGIIVNLSSLYQILSGWPPTDSLLKTAELLAGLTTPLIAIVIGYELQFEQISLWKPFQTVFIRMIVWISLAVVFNVLIIRQMLGLNPLFEAAVMIMAVLPAPFVIPIYLKAENDLNERAYILNTLSIGTVAALVGSVLVRLVY